MNCDVTVMFPPLDDSRRKETLRRAAAGLVYGVAGTSRLRTACCSRTASGARCSAGA